MGINMSRVLGLGIALAVTACGFSTAHARDVTFTLKAGEVASKDARHFEDDGVCAFISEGTGPRLVPAPNDLHVRAIIGWELSVDYGTDPFPCATALRHDYIAALYFDLTRVLAEGGVVAHAELRFHRTDTVFPISIPGWGPDACTLYALAPTSDWIGGYHLGDETDPEANPPASLLYSGTPPTPVTFLNSSDPAYADQTIDVTQLIATAVLSRGSRYHGILLSPRRDPDWRPNYLEHTPLLGGPPNGSCTGLFGDFELKIVITHIER
jgi:hypothetical protein